MRKVTKFGIGLVAVGFTFLATSCVFFRGPADNFLHVRGRIELGAAPTTTTCTLALFREHGKKPVQTINIDLDFHRSLAIAPSRGKYYMVISCAGIRSQYKSRVYDPRAPGPTIDLGTVELTAQPKSTTGEPQDRQRPDNI